MHRDRAEGSRYKVEWWSLAIVRKERSSTEQATHWEGLAGAIRRSLSPHTTKRCHQFLVCILGSYRFFIHRNGGFFVDCPNRNACAMCILIWRRRQLTPTHHTICTNRSRPRCSVPGATHPKTVVKYGLQFDFFFASFPDYHHLGAISSKRSISIRRRCFFFSVIDVFVCVCCFRVKRTNQHSIATDRP